MRECVWRGEGGRAGVRFWPWSGLGRSGPAGPDGPAQLT